MAQALAAGPGPELPTFLVRDAESLPRAGGREIRPPTWIVSASACTVAARQHKSGLLPTVVAWSLPEAAAKVL
jgi:hypothetical protein